MSTAQLQKTITKQVLTIQDENLLEQVLAFLQQKPIETKLETKPNSKNSKKPTKKKINIGDPEHPYYDKLTPSEEKNIEKAINNYKKGQYITFNPEEEFNLENIEKKLEELNKKPKKPLLV